MNVECTFSIMETRSCSQLNAQVELKFSEEVQYENCVSVGKGAPVGGSDEQRCIRFKYPSYVQDIMGDIFSLGFGPFRLGRTLYETLFIFSLDGYAHLVWKVIFNKRITLLEISLKSSCQQKIVSVASDMFSEYEFLAV